MAGVGDGAAVHLTGLTKRFDERYAVRDVTLTVQRGQVFGFLGPNGAGKSTTIRMLMGLYRPSVGSCEALGLDPLVHGVALRRRTGYLPGELALPGTLSGRELLGRWARMRGGGIPQTVVDSLASRFRAELDRPMHTLSKGNKQKIGIVQAFMHTPELLVLDEPTSGLDPLLQREFATLLEEVVDRGGTVFLSSHDLDEVQRLAHQIAIIKDGRLVLVDTVEGLRSRAPRTVQLTFARPVDPGVLAALPGVQVRSSTERSVDLAVDGAFAPLLRAAADLDVTDVLATPAGLDDLFRSFYAQGDADGH